MLTAELSRTALALPVEDRLELARRILESVAAPAPLTDAATEGIRRIEEIASGKIPGLTEEEFRTALA
jgi:putative addiction module component (TIGR02574 family)